MCTGYAILREHSLILETITGISIYEGVVQQRMLVFSDAKYDKTYDVLVDLRCSEITAIIDNIARFIKKTQESANGLLDKKFVFLVQDPNQITSSAELKKLDGKLPHSVQIMKSLDAALAWLERSTAFSDVETRLRYLKENPKYTWSDKFQTIQ